MIEPNKFRHFTDIYHLTDYKPILPPREDRNRKINELLKSGKLSDINN